MCTKKSHYWSEIDSLRDLTNPLTEAIVKLMYNILLTASWFHFVSSKGGDEVGNVILLSFHSVCKFDTNTAFLDFKTFVLHMKKQREWKRAGIWNHCWNHGTSWVSFWLTDADFSGALQTKSKLSPKVEYLYGLSYSHLKVAGMDKCYYVRPIKVRRYLRN